MSPSKPQTPTEPYDIICIGFGVTGLSIAIALQDRSPQSKVLFLEKEREISWQPGLTIPGARMRLSLMHDLVTARNPRSKFTFVNYLHTTNQLLTFTNLGSLRAPREQFGKYLAWCAAAFKNQVRFGVEAASIEPNKSIKGVTEGWNVSCREGQTGRTLSFSGKRIICANGLSSNIPMAIANPQVFPSVIHSSQYPEIILRLQEQSNSTKSIAVIGGNQHAAEIFEHLQSLPDSYRATLFIHDAFLYPNTDHGFTGDIMHPTQGAFAHMPPELRRKTILQKGRDEPPTVDLALIERLYELQNEQKAHCPDPTKQRFGIAPLHELVGAESVDGRVLLKFQDSKTGLPLSTPESFDFVVAATGYKHDSYERLLAQSTKELFDGKDMTVGRDYGVNFRRGAVRNGCGMYVLGAISSEDDNDDAVFRMLALRTEMVVDSLLKPTKREVVKAELEDMQPRL